MGLEEAVAYALSEEETPTAVQAPDRRLASEVPPALTRREEEVAALVVQGLTYRQIAARLARIALRTVSYTHSGE